MSETTSEAWSVEVLPSDSGEHSTSEQRWFNVVILNWAQNCDKVRFADLPTFTHADTHLDINYAAVIYHFNMSFTVCAFVAVDKV